MSNKKQKQEEKKETANENEESTVESSTDIPVEKEIHVDYKDKYLRAHADYQNLVRETNERRTEWANMSEVQVLEAFIPVYDNFKKAAAHQPTEESSSWKNWGMGIGFIEKQFAEVLKRFGIEEISTVGSVFDPNKHESVGEEESDEYDEDVILKEIESGYKKGNKIIKVAKVIVSKEK